MSCKGSEVCEMATVDIRRHNQGNFIGFGGSRSPAEYGDQAFTVASKWMIFLQLMVGSDLEESMCSIF